MGKLFHKVDERDTLASQDLDSATERGSEALEERDLKADDLKLPHVADMELVLKYMTSTRRYIIFSTMLLFAYANSLEGYVGGSYIPYALSYMKEHSLQAVVTLVATVASVSAMFISGKISDIFGRLETFCFGMVLSVVGLILEAAAHNVDTISGGTVLLQVGTQYRTNLIYVIIADLTSTRSRAFFSNILSLPAIINTWVSGDIVSSVLANTTWRWGIGMWALILPVIAQPFILSLYWTMRTVKRQHGTPTEASPEAFPEEFSEKPSPPAHGRWHRFFKFCVDLFWLLDVVGVLLLTAILGLILIPLTLAGGEQKKWKRGSIIAPLAVGFACIPVFVLWESKTKIPLIRTKLMKNRGVWAPIGVNIFWTFTRSIVADYLFTVLIVAFGFSTTQATRISSIFSFVDAFIGPLAGIAIYKTRRIKPFILFGLAVYLASFGLYIRYRGSPSGSGRVGMVAGLVLTGVAGGFVMNPVTASLQAVLEHRDLAVVMGVCSALGSVGASFGVTVSGALWTQLLPGKLEKYLANINPSLAKVAYESPLTAIVPHYPIGTPERTAVIHAYQYIQRILAITGIALCGPMVIFALFMPNIKLSDEQTLARTNEEAEGENDNSRASERTVSIDEGRSNIHLGV